MSRYLTPSKVCLLCLVSLYCNGRVSQNASMKVLSFVVSRLVPTKPLATHDDAAPLSQAFAPTIKDFSEALEGHQSHEPERTVFDALVIRLWEFVSGVDGLFDFFGTLDQMLVSSPGGQAHDAAGAWDNMRQRGAQEYVVKLLKTSMLGAFVRKARLEFARLQFQDVVNLWRSFQLFREPTMQLYLQLGNGGPPTHEDPEIEELDSVSFGRLFNVAYPPSNEPSSKWTESLDDTQKLFRFQIDKMQKCGGRLPLDMLDRLEESLKQSHNSQNMSYYLRFLDAWYAGDYQSSFEFLHRHYDYAMLSSNRSHYQYALLNMAILQADFGCYQEAAAAMKETIATARENKDTYCLNFSLNWLYHFGKLSPKEVKRDTPETLLGSDKNALAFLKAKSKYPSSHAVPMQSIWSTVLLSEARLCLSQGEDVRDAFEKIYQSGHLNILCNLTGLFSAPMLVHCAIYERLGVTGLVYDYCNIIRHCYANQSPIEKNVQTSCILAHMERQYGQAESTLKQIRQEVSKTLTMQQYVAGYERLLILKRSLHHNNLDIAENLLASCNAAPTSDQDLDFEISMLRIDLHVRRGSYSDAFNQVDALAAKYENQERDVFQRIRLCSLKASIFCKCGRHQKGLSLALRAVSAAWQAEIVPALLDALATLVMILLHLEELLAADEILEAAIPQAVEAGHPLLIAQLWSLKADRDMKAAALTAKDSQNRLPALKSALQAVAMANRCFQQLEDVRGQREMTAKESLILSLMGHTQGASEASKRYFEIREYTDDE